MNLIEKLENYNILTNGSITCHSERNLIKHPLLYNEVIFITSFLTGNPQVKIRLHCIINNITSHPKCHYCGNDTSYSTTRSKFNTHCSRNCINADKQLVKKRERTMLDKYGVTNANYSEEIQQKKKQKCLDKHNVEYVTQTTLFKNKAQQTMLDRYGVTNANYSKEIQQKKKQNCLDNYGVENPMQSIEVRQRYETTMLERYNTKYPMQLEQCKQARERTMLDKYGVTNANYSEEIQQKKKQKCLDNYGVEHPWSSPKIRQKITITHQHLFNRKFSNQQHIPLDIIERLEDNDWLIYQHITLKKPLCMIAEELSVDPVTVGRYAHNHNIEIKHFHQSTGEKQLSQFLSNHKISHDTSNRHIISPYELDIYIPQHNLAIEYCGLYWHSEQMGKDRHYHKNKHDLCKQQDVQLLTIFEDEWQQRRTQVENKILILCGIRNNNVTFARKCKIINVNTHTKQQFFDDNHIQGNGPGSINYGLEYEGKLVACMSFVKQKDGVFYLNRYATSSNVVGGFSKLLKYFEQNNTWSQIISFADKRWSDGNLYFKTGFTHETDIVPDYSYSPDGQTRLHKFNYRRKHLPKLLAKFDSNLSETQNCNNNGILRIWDCGKMRFIKNNI